MKIDPQGPVGTALESLRFKVGGETLSPQNASVLSCGGIFFPRQTIPTELRTWRQIIHLPGDQARIFGLNKPDPHELLFSLLQKDGMN